MSALTERAEQVRRDIELLSDGGALIIAATKTRTIEEILPLLDCGIADIGENRVQEFVRKREALTGKFHMHLIGQLQTNKLKYILNTGTILHSLDRMRLAEAISAELPPGAVQEVLIQINIGREAQKGGVPPEEYEALAEAVLASPNLRLRGLMAVMPDIGGEACRPLFRAMRAQFEELRRVHPSADMLSMGMSGDYRVALSEGSNVLRLGSALFGAR